MPSILAYICTPGEFVILQNLEEADIQDGSPGLVLGIRRGQVEVKLLYSGRSVLVYPENFVDANEESSDESIDDDYDDDEDSDGFISLSEIASLKKKYPRGRSGKSSQSNKKQRLSDSDTASSKTDNGFSQFHSLHSSNAGNVFLSEKASNSDTIEDGFAENGEEDASHWLRRIRIEIDNGNDKKAEQLLRNILKHYQYCTAAWVELAAILVRQQSYQAAFQAFNKIVHSCPLKSDFQTFSDTIQMYLIAHRLISSIQNCKENLPDEPSNIISTFSPSEHSTTEISSDSPYVATVYTSTTTDLSPSVFSFPSGLETGHSSAVGPLSLSGGDVLSPSSAELMSTAQMLTEQQLLQCRWLTVRALIRGINIARAAGMQIRFVNHTLPSGKQTQRPCVEIDSSREYLRPFASQLFYELALTLFGLAKCYQVTLQPNNCLAGAYILAKLCVHDVDREQQILEHQELLSQCENLLRDEGALTEF